MGHSQVLEKVSAHIAELLVLKIESMTQTWQKPWFYGQGLLPCNITGKRYTGTNLLTLLMLTEVKGYRTPVFPDLSSGQRTRPDGQEGLQTVPGGILETFLPGE